MFIAVLFTIAKTWKQPKCPRNLDEWIKKMYMCVCVQWMNVEIVILSEVSQTEKEKYHMMFLICII